MVLFAVGAGVIGTADWSPYYDPFRDYFINPTIGHWVSLWSVLLVAHGVWSFWRSRRRDEAVESEMREQLQANDLYLSEHPKDLFRLHGLLSDDIRRRHRHIPLLVVFAVVNAFIWIPWTVTGEAGTSFAWQTSFLLVIPFILTLLWSIWRRVQHEKRLRKQLEAAFSWENREDDQNYERDMRLGNDGELITVDDYMLKQKRKRA